MSLPSLHGYHASRMFQLLSDKLQATLGDLRSRGALSEEDIELWLGELRAPIEDVKDLIKIYEFDPEEWETVQEDPSKKPPTPRKPKREKDEPRLF